MKLQSSYWPGLCLLEGSTGVGGAASKVVHLAMGTFPWHLAMGRGLQSTPCGPLGRAVPGSLQCDSWLPQEPVTIKRKQEEAATPGLTNSEATL